MTLRMNYLLALIRQFAMIPAPPRGGLRLLDSNIDDQLSALGQVPPNLSELVSRFVGAQPLTLAEVDALLANLTEAGDLPAPSEALRNEGEGPSQLPAAASSVAAGSSAEISAAPLSSPPSFTPSPLTAAVAPLFDSRPPPASAPPPVFETRSAPVDPSSNPSSVFDEKPDPEATAQAIVAAFDDPEVDTSGADMASLERALDALESSPAAAMPSENAPAAARSVEVDLERAPRAMRGERGGSRRPDLDELLDQPLDALDFERTEPVADDEEGADARSSSNAPTDLPPPSASGDDFEILVDDEILEIAEDDVEMVDDESSN
jgi:hypothetical protein